MLQKNYSIYSDDLSDVQLFVEAGKNHVACWCKKAGDKTLKAFEFFLCDDYTMASLGELITNIRLQSRLLSLPVSKTNFFWNTDEVLCLPAGKNDDAFLKANFDLMFGNTADWKIFSELTGECLVAWSMADEQQQIVQQGLGNTSFTHSYIPLLRLPAENKNGFYLVFYPHYFTLVVYKEDKLQLAQTRKYAMPEDVLYFILNVFEQYNIEKNADIFCGGFINERSTLYDMLHQYLEGLQLMQVDETLFANEEFRQYSSHYFMPYINYDV